MDNSESQNLQKNLNERARTKAYQEYPPSFIGGIDILAGKREAFIEAYKLGAEDPSRSEALDKVLDIAAWIDDYSVHNKSCYDNRKSLDECLCGLSEARSRLRELRKG